MALLNIDADVFAMNLKQGTRRLLASDGALFPILDDRDQMAIIFSGSEGIFQQPAEGGQDVQTLVRPVRGNASGETGAYPVGALVPTSWNAATGDLALFDDTSDIWVRRADGALHTFLNSDAHERTGRFSPDGRWLAYVSNETGDYQGYVTAYPGPGRTLAVSIDGGLSPIWAPDQKALFFRNGGQVLMARITGGGELAFEPPERLFAGPYTVDLMGHQRWDVAPDGERFLMVESSEDFRIVIVENGVFGAAQTPRASR